MPTDRPETLFQLCISLVVIFGWSVPLYRTSLLRLIAIVHVIFGSTSTVLDGVQCAYQRFLSGPRAAHTVQIGQHLENVHHCLAPRFGPESVRMEPSGHLHLCCALLGNRACHQPSQNVSHDDAPEPPVGFPKCNQPTAPCSELTTDLHGQEGNQLHLCPAAVSNGPLSCLTALEQRLAGHISRSSRTPPAPLWLELRNVFGEHSVAPVVV